MSDSSLLKQLLEDQLFLDWARSGGREEDAYWQQLRAQYPEQKETLEEAKRVLIEITQRRHSLSAAKNEKLRRRVLPSVDQPVLTEVDTQQISNRQPRYLWLKAAAIVLLVGLGGWVAWWLTSIEYATTYRTSYGEIKEIMLPDSSLVTLNANSTLKYRYDAERQQREAWLTGEGFFDVRKSEIQSTDNSSQPVSFLVNVEQVSVQVLGTRFNVKHRGEHTQIVLEEGSIQLKMDDLNETLLMQPDEMVEVRQGSGKINQQLVEVQNFSIWKEGLLRFEGASFEEIRIVLADNYGLQLRFVDPQMSEQIQLRGVFPIENIDLLLEAIANVTGTSVERQGGVVEFQ